MMERVEPKAPLGVRPATPLNLPAVPKHYSPAAPSAGSVMELPLGEIAGDFHAIAGHGNKSASYELLVSNDTPRPLATFAYAAQGSGRRDRITWNAILVPPYSAIAVEIDVALPRRGRPPRVLAELHAEDAKLTLDGGPPHQYSRGLARRATLLASALLLLALGTASIAKTQPHVEALGAPETVRGGAPFSVAYAVGHSSDADYTVDTADGLEVARGTLHDGAGSFMLALPSKHVSTGYDIHVNARGRFGADVRSAHVVALAASGADQKTLRVQGLALEAETVRGGGTIAVNYKTSAQSGYVRLIDEIGTVRAEALLNPHGRSILQAPYVDADQDLRVVVDAQMGAARAEGEVPVRILRSDPGIVAALPGASGMLVPALVGDPGDPSDPTTNSGDPSQAAQPAAATSDSVPVENMNDDTAAAVVPADDARGIISVARIQHLDAPIVVRVDRYEPGLRVALMGDSGDEIEGVDLNEGDTHAILPAITGHPQRLSVVATYARGFGQETFIRPITLKR
jgi:hypothetical protein